MKSIVHSIAIKGGIGDFLQYLPFVLAHPQYRYLVASHLACPEEFFSAFGIEVEEVSLLDVWVALISARVVVFDSNPFLQEPLLFTNNRPVIGVHLGGSSYSVNIEDRFGFPSKTLPVTVFNALVSAGTQYNFLLFGVCS